MIIKNLNGYANQFLINDEKENKIFFQSYKSLIAEYDKTNNTLKLYTDWDYSKTTLRHLKAFINEETPFNYINKADFEKEIRDNNQIIMEV